MERKEDIQKGHLHPLTHIITEVTDIFQELGFSVAAGPEMESTFFNFDALNVPKDHPSRDMQDTFFINDETVMRTHTSPVQVRYMNDNKPPIRIIVPGKVFRNEATDATHEAQFHQIEGLYVDKEVNLGHLKGVLEEFLHKFFGKEVGIRLRPGFFPFVEPGVEVDMLCFKCGGDGCGVCKKSGWIEILGAGLVHPNVLDSVGVDSKQWQGFAFGCWFGSYSNDEIRSR